jgi:cell wall-associated NlpC family hydrolase
MSSTTARTAVTLAVAGAVSATAFAEPGQADPRPTPEQIKERVDDLYQRAETATQRYDGVKARAEKLRRQLESLQTQLARRTQQANATRDRLGSVAANQYRTGGPDPTLQLILSSDPGEYLERAAMLERADSDQAATLRTLARQEEAERTLRDQAARQLAAIEATQRQLAAEKKTVTGELDDAKALAAQLTPGQRAALAASDPVGSGALARIVPTGSTAPSARAAEAVAFAYAQLGKPYVWGATGPGSYDCSGLTQAAWAAAGVSLPRTTYTQINAGHRVAESQLEPGDLVFYYAGVSHVGIYVGHGHIIHAPHPGAVVRLAPVNEMPFAGATRPY